MRIMIESRYPYIVRYRGGDVELIPGENLIEEEVWRSLLAGVPRLHGQIQEGKVIVGQSYAEHFLADVENKTYSIMPDSLRADEARWVVEHISDVSLLKDLAPQAHRGGVRLAFENAVKGGK